MTGGARKKDSIDGRKSIDKINSTNGKERFWPEWHLHNSAARKASGPRESTYVNLLLP